ncbi:AAA family ATPase [Singulisphaera sp. PoT]|uniref:AAA family ATPase n=1 Tax=Singulisphaera sp. PoT TaxID=3411797 RepID=UPI003BF5A83B
MDTFDFLSSSLALPGDAIAYSVSRRLAPHFPDRAVLEGMLSYCDIEAYAAAGLCRLEPRGDVHNQLSAAWDENCGVSKSARNAWFRIAWRDQILEALILTWSTGFHEQKHLWIIADDEATAEAFFSECSAWNAEIRDEVLVFDGGCWSKSGELFHSIKNATLENLVLSGTLKEEIRDDLSRFFATRATYEQHGVPWKRGVLFVGPPGNGKTHAIKALINALKMPCLYVKSFQADHATEHDCIRQVFARTRRSAPCILVLEDLDSLINAGNRSFFLNELDGFADNTGILALATTNHPERLDPAILDRPSRFDRKYHFDLPGPDERLAYVRLWSAELGEALRPTEEGLAEVVIQTEGFSFAYLKELFLSSMMRWISSPGDLAMDAILLEQSASLLEQMASAPPEPSAEEAAAGPPIPPWMRHMPRRFRRP